MTQLFIGLYGLFFILVGVNGNSFKLVSAMREDTPNFFPWLLAIISISFLSQFEATEKLVKPFVVLLILNFALRNYDTISREINSLWPESLNNGVLKNG